MWRTGCGAWGPRRSWVSAAAESPTPPSTRCIPSSALDDVLPRTKILVMALPSTPETVHILNRERIALLPADACVINVGRGTALDQKALAEALNSGKLAGAALDVMDPEPLPRRSSVGRPEHHSTPHVSGNMTLGYTCDENVARFCADLENYAAGARWRDWWTGTGDIKQSAGAGQ